MTIFKIYKLSTLLRTLYLFFATLIFFEKQAEMHGGGEEAEFTANTTLKNLSEMTAAFGGGK